MYSQKNVLQVFVSPFNAPQTVVGVALADLAVGEIGFFHVNDAVTVASGEGYFAFNDNGTIRKSNPVRNFSWDVKAYAAPVAKVSTLTVALGATGDWHQVTVLVRADNNNGDEYKKGSYKQAAGDDLAAVTAGLMTSLGASIARDDVKNIALTSSGAGNLTITALEWPYKVGRKGILFTRFVASVNSPVASEETVTQVGSNGIGSGKWIYSKEFFARQNHDAVSINEFRTAFDIPLLSSPSGTYNVQGISGGWREFGLSDNVKALPRQVICAFASGGTAPSVPTP